ncbi:hypothetical protein BMS3Abin04_02939 [bacterium BMS3Abin04]|nr:hypothetical protein BMS3Abin04_02939 [bacterium BMS3Abin04]
MVALIGKVLINNPSIVSEPVRSVGLPENVAPKTTSSSPLYFASKIAHTACKKLLIVILFLFAYSIILYERSVSRTLFSFKYEFSLFSSKGIIDLIFNGVGDEKPAK